MEMLGTSVRVMMDILTPRFISVMMQNWLMSDPLPMDADEEITVETWPLDELAMMAIDGRLEDAKSVVAILRASSHLSQAK